MSLFQKNYSIANVFDKRADAVVALDDSLRFTKTLPDNFFRLIISSPPYNIGKVYEKQVSIEDYLKQIDPLLKELVRVLARDGSFCWQVGNYVNDGEIYPLDMFFYHQFKSLGLQLRNRIVWHFDHGLHASHRFSGRYETLLWFTKTNDYIFNLDPVRVPSKYPGKTHFKGEKKGLPSGNPLGKNPSDFWTLLQKEWDCSTWEFPNVKANHPEKMNHPCQFPIELVERCVLSMTDEGDWVYDPFMGSGSATVAALKHNRKAIGVDYLPEYVELTKKRIGLLGSGELRIRPIGKPIHQPTGQEKISQRPPLWQEPIAQLI
ncbi:MAG: DNA methyltransferase [Alphaproteobacteria bacterium RIFCSPLOWO2_01_FULL_40_26]|nr:MAG: DNA methyltransferase [Alphaproteobacteria bacterium RIFCSPHIGHO2_02_FULL_40_34]OFW85348.1 MAG: DNA methyltransferase [Alphaproteobacteria bacterium RIFCSPHIGHO2_01_FULL_40_8]OFW95207.1 MAG: DNA methyltransferase [Alphaproteobacteria bacterium RIFCSPLOWO2_01_FULL_40_26]OFX09957.1 MAG: DNA methyltransferase [Alphaproteobacteria bacterium RIFCSPLOWO2_02_FULL_40_19]OFX12348.1 MAG: DNA methyltransferase [Alphaproteobacteria bacterium RIFCSPLOWO2_12_FULL_40_11]